MFTPIQIGEDEQPILTLRIFFKWVETQPPTSSLLTGDFVDHVTGPTAPTAVQERLFFNSEVSTRRGGQRFLQNRSERSHIIPFTLRIIGPSSHWRHFEDLNTRASYRFKLTLPGRRAEDP